MDSTRQIAPLGNQKGIALVFIALMIAILCGFLGLAVDVGHRYVVRGQLQNAADAAALAGAWSLYRPFSSGELPTLDWERAREAATNFIKENKSDRTALTDGAIEVGYWNLTAKIMQSSAITPTSEDVPAVRVSISRSDGSNGGPVRMLFMKILDITKDAAPEYSRPAVAVSGYPGAVPGGSLFPMALSSCMTDHYFSQNPLPSPAPSINISSVYVPGGTGCYTGQWTSFQLDTNNVPDVTDLMNTGNPEPLQTGDDIWIQPGAKASLYKEVNNWLPPSGGKDVLMAIVGSNSGDITTHSEMTIKGFASFHIDSANQGAKYVTGHFIEYFKEYPGIRPGGSVSNTVTPPLMVQ